MYNGLFVPSSRWTYFYYTYIQSTKYEYNFYKYTNSFSVCICMYNSFVNYRVSSEIQINTYSFMHPRQFSDTHAQYVQRRLASLAVNVYVFFSSSIPIAVIHALNINRFM